LSISFAFIFTFLPGGFIIWEFSQTNPPAD
jgi:hypothetical protein